MRLIQPGLCALLLAAGGGWVAWLTGGVRSDDIAAAGLGIAVTVSFAAYMTTDRKVAALWLRFGLYGGALAVSAASLWTGAVLPLLPAPSFGAATAWLKGLDGLALAMFVAPLPIAGVLCLLFFEVAVASLRHLRGSERRRRARSDLHGHASLLGRRFLRRLA